MIVPRHLVASRRQDRLVRALSRCEPQLQAWISQSPKNARWFRKDPLAAMRAAGLKLDADLMGELEQIMTGIARKVK